MSYNNSQCCVTMCKQHRSVLCVNPVSPVKPRLIGGFLVLLGYWRLWHSQHFLFHLLQHASANPLLRLNTLGSLLLKRGYLCWNYSRGITRPSVWVFWLQTVSSAKPPWTHQHHLWNKSTELENILRLTSSINLTAFILMMPITFIKWTGGIHGPRGCDSSFHLRGRGCSALSVLVGHSTNVKAEHVGRVERVVLTHICDFGRCKRFLCPSIFKGI